MKQLNLFEPRQEDPEDYCYCNDGYVVAKEYERYIDEQGFCPICKEWCDVLQPCCGSTSIYEGDEMSCDDAWIPCPKCNDTDEGNIE